jgi:CubicO group peptidase (beta-lactamase class C family)
MTTPWEQFPFNEDFDTLVKEELKKWKVPGLSIAIVDGPNTYSNVSMMRKIGEPSAHQGKAYGMAEIPTESIVAHQPSTSRTMNIQSLFPVCSTTKAFTGAATSIAIQESKGTACPIAWDTPVVSLIPEDFVLENDYATQNITLEDALSHRSGMPEHGWTVAFMRKKDTTMQDAVQAMKHLPLASPPRTKFHYSNHMYIAVSHALEQHTGEPLGEFMKTRIWEPLGMNETYFSTDDIKADSSNSDKLARGYDWLPSGKDGIFLPQPHNDWSANSGAGAITSNVVDYAHWIRELIEMKGPLQGHDSLTEPRTFHFQNDDLNVPAPYHAYALGWFVDHYRGHNLYSHPGGWPGFGSWVGFIPERKFGFVVMGNSFSARYAAFRLVTYLLDKQLAMPYDPLHEEKIAACITRQYKEWNARLDKEDIEDAKRRLFGSLLDPPIPRTLPLSKYAGTYKHPSSASIILREYSGSLSAELHDRVIPSDLSIVHASGEMFVGTLHNRGLHLMPSFAVEFGIDNTGLVAKVGLLLESELKGENIWFKRCEE